MSKDKTSWLNLDDDDDALTDQPSAGTFTETVGGGQAGVKTRYDGGAGPNDNADMRTVIDSTVEKTQLFVNSAAGFEEDVDPVVGWLVVVSGPGLGKSVTLGAGMNTLGRDTESSVPLPFGDTQISAADHLRIIYDNESRSFFVAPGSGRNVSRLNKMIIATTMPLPNHSVLSISKNTHLKFVAFCDENFDWADLPPATA
jgi:hypothetical protein